MTMTDAAPTKPSAMPAPPKGMEPIRVRELRFVHPGGGGGGIDLGQPFRSGIVPMLQAGTRNSNEETLIQYEPWSRMYRVRLVIGGTLTAERCIPESWAMYEPAPA